MPQIFHLGANNLCSNKRLKRISTTHKMAGKAIKINPKMMLKIKNIYSKRTYTNNFLSRFSHSMALSPSIICFTESGIDKERINSPGISSPKG